MKILLIIAISVASFIAGAGAMFFIGGKLYLEEHVERSRITSMKGNAFTLVMLKQGKQDVAIEFLEGAIAFDKDELAHIDTESFSSEGKRQVTILNGVYEELAMLEGSQW